MLVPMLDELIHDAAEARTREVLIGMAHRGRLNVLAHVLGKPYAAIFSEFHTAPNKELVPSEGSAGINYGWTGDVKYHLGARRTVREGDLVAGALTLAPQPQPPGVRQPGGAGLRPRGAGAARRARRAAAGYRRGARGHDPRRRRLPGEGVVAETLNLSRLPGYQTGGTIHIIANNQIGFTTGRRPGAARPSTPATWPRASRSRSSMSTPTTRRPAWRRCALAHAYRQRFHKDFLIDLVGYRRWGHNEGDEPTFTQPLLYAKIAEHPTRARRCTPRRWQAEGVVAPRDAEAMRREVQRAAAAGASTRPRRATSRTSRPRWSESPRAGQRRHGGSSGCAAGDERGAAGAPGGLHAEYRSWSASWRGARAGIEKPGGIDWGHAETLAFAAILADGTPIRLTGQDTERGTFSQRHVVLHDAKTGAPYHPAPGAAAGAGLLRASTTARSPRRRCSASSTATASTRPTRWCSGRRSSATSPTPGRC